MTKVNLQTYNGKRPHPMMSTEDAYRQQIARFGTVLARAPETMTWDELVKAAQRADEDAALALESSILIYQ